MNDLHSFAVRDRYSEEPCNELLEGALDNKQYATAMGFVPTHRFKKWKPNDRDGSAYCYIDNDKPNNKQDPLMKYATCSKSDRIFAEDFIGEVFMDNRSDRNQNYPFSKCVFEIKKENITPQKLNGFWGNIGTSDCEASFVDARVENERMKKEIDEFEINGLQLKEHINNQGLEMRAGEKAIQNLMAEKQAIESVKRSIEELKMRQNEIDKSIKANDLEFKKNKSKFDQDTKNIEIVLEDLKTDISKRETQIQKIDRAEQFIKKETIILELTVQNMKESKGYLEKENRDLANATRQKEQDLAYCLANYRSCEQQRLVLKNKILELQSNIEYLRKRILFYKQCVERKRIQKLIDDCQKNVELLRIKLSDLERIIEEWKKNHQDCSFYITQIAILQQSIEKDLALCKIQSDQYQSNVQFLRSEYKESQVGATCPFTLPPIAPPPYSLNKFYDDYKSIRIQYPNGWNANMDFGYVNWMQYWNDGGNPKRYGGFPTDGIYGGQWRSSGLIPKYSTGAIGQETDRKVFIWISPLFRVSQEVVGTLKMGVCDDRGFIFINGSQFYKTLPNANDNPVLNYTFKVNTPYYLTCVLLNVRGNARFEPTMNCFQELVSFLCYANPQM